MSMIDKPTSDPNSVAPLSDPSIEEQNQNSLSITSNKPESAQEAHQKAAHLASIAADEISAATSNKADLRKYLPSDFPNIPMPSGDHVVSFAEFARLMLYWSAKVQGLDKALYAQNNQDSYNLHQQNANDAAHAIKQMNQVGDIFQGDLSLMLENNALTAGINATVKAAKDTFDGVGAMFQRVGVALKNSADAVRDSLKTTGDLIAGMAKQLANVPGDAVNSFVKNASEIAGKIVSGKLSIDDIGKAIGNVANDIASSIVKGVKDAIAYANEKIKDYNKINAEYASLKGDYEKAGTAFNNKIKEANDEYNKMWDPIIKRNNLVKADFPGLPMLPLGSIDFKFPSFPPLSSLGISDALAPITHMFDNFKVSASWQSTKIYDDVKVAGVTIFPGLSLPLPHFSVTGLPSIPNVNLTPVFNKLWGDVVNFAQGIGDMFKPLWGAYFSGGIMPAVNELMHNLNVRGLTEKALSNLSKQLEDDLMDKLDPATKKALKDLLTGGVPTSVDQVKDRAKRLGIVDIDKETDQINKAIRDKVAEEVQKQADNSNK